MLYSKYYVKSNKNSVQVTKDHKLFKPCYNIMKQLGELITIAEAERDVSGKHYKHYNCPLSLQITQYLISCRKGKLNEFFCCIFVLKKLRLWKFVRIGAKMKNNRDEYAAFAKLIQQNHLAKKVIFASIDKD